MPGARPTRASPTSRSSCSRSSAGLISSTSSALSATLGGAATLTAGLAAARAARAMELKVRASCPPPLPGDCLLKPRLRRSSVCLRRRPRDPRRPRALVLTRRPRRLARRAPAPFRGAQRPAREARGRVLLVLGPVGPRDPAQDGVDRPGGAWEVHPFDPGEPGAPRLLSRAAARRRRLANPPPSSLQDPEAGGFSDRANNQTDVFHTCFALCGLSLLGFEGLGRIDPVFCLPEGTVRGREGLGRAWERVERGAQGRRNEEARRAREA